MSPSESELRAALRAGQGEALDTERVISRAQVARRQRQVRYASVAAVTAIVAGVGVAAGIALSGGDRPALNTVAGGSAGSAAAAPRAAGGVLSPSGTMAAMQCPAILPVLRTAPAYAPAPLMPEPVASITVCLYAETGGPPLRDRGGATITESIGGEQATTLAESLNNASTVKQGRMCPLYRTANGRTLLMTGIRADGTELPPVEASVLQNPCGQAVTNGTAVRYDWAPPSLLTSFLSRATAR